MKAPTNKKDPTSKRKKQDKKKLEELAYDLAVNHYRHSFTLEESRNLDRLNIILNNKNSTKKSSKFTRTIFIVGAGASTNASHNVFPAGNQAIELIEKYFARNKWPKGIKEKADKVQTLVNLPSMEELVDFETRLFALSHFFNISDVQQAIEQIYNHRTFPNLFYETLAHLLKNRFIDGIINFNFDELLDQSVEEEVGMGQLHKVLSDGDCLDYTDMLVDDKLKVPFYIKPHGTITHKSSLLFTKEHYINIPSDIERLLEEILTGQPIKGNKVSRQFQQLNIITAGFQMESIEFNKVLRRSVKKLGESNIRVKIIYLSYSDSPENLDRVKANIRKICNNKTDDIRKIEIHTLALKSFKVSPNRSTGLDSYLEGRYLDHFGLNLIDAIRGNFQSSYVPRDITRHLGLISFFQKRIAQVNKHYHYNDFKCIKFNKPNPFLERKKNIYFESKEYFLERTIFEIINVVLKNNGIIQPKESLKGINRIGIYFNLYVKKHRKNYSDKGAHLSSESISKELSFYDLLKALCLESKLGINDKEIFQRPFPDKEKKRTFESIMRTWIKDVKKMDKNKPKNDYYKKFEHLAKLKKVCLECLWNFKFSYENIFFHQENTGKAAQKKEKNSGNDLIKSASISLYPNYKDVQLNIISKLDSKNIVPTNLSLNFRYRSMFMDPSKKWNKLHIVSDQALVTLNVLKEVKRRKISYPKKKKIFAVVSDPYLKEQIVDCVNEIPNLYIKIFNIPYYDHSRHMALFTADKMSNARAIYYYKKGYSNNINAVYLEGLSNRSNIGMLFQTFRQYLAKSISYMSSKRAKDRIAFLPHFTDEAQIGDVIAEAPKAILTTSDKKHFKEYNPAIAKP